MEKLLKVTGKGNIKVVPDLTVISVTLSKTESTYKKALESSNNESKILKGLLNDVGIKDKEIKTKNFSVEPHYAYYKDKYNESKSKVDGYTFQNKMEFRFDIDNKLLGKVLYQLTKCTTSSNVDISYSFKDVEGAKNLLLKSAVEDAVKKANILAETSKVELLGINSISYCFDELDFTISPFDHRMRNYMVDECCSIGSMDMDINPDDISLSDNVTITWTIK